MLNQSLPLVNFAQEAGWNPIEAWLMQASPVITGSTGVDNLAHTVMSFQQAHSPKFCADKNGKLVDCNSPDRVQGGATGGADNNPIYGNNSPQSPSTANPPDSSGDWHQEDIWVDAQGNQVPPNTLGATKNTMWVRGAGLLSGLTSNADNWYKRIMLGVVAIVIIAIAVVSLR